MRGVPRQAAWLVKSEPYKYGYADLVRDGLTAWDGVRNYEARNNLRAMKKGDLLLFYHSNEGKAVVGFATVAREAYPDPTSDEDWSVVDVAPLAPLVRPVTLATIKATPALAGMSMLRRSRLSVVDVAWPEVEVIARLSGTRLPGARRAR